MQTIKFVNFWYFFAKLKWICNWIVFTMLLFSRLLQPLCHLVTNHMTSVHKWICIRLRNIRYWFVSILWNKINWVDVRMAVLLSTFEWTSSKKNGNSKENSRKTGKDCYSWRWIQDKHTALKWWSRCALKKIDDISNITIFYRCFF